MKLTLDFLFKNKIHYHVLTRVANNKKFQNIDFPENCEITTDNYLLFLDLSIIIHYLNHILKIKKIRYEIKKNNHYINFTEYYFDTNGNLIKINKNNKWEVMLYDNNNNIISHEFSNGLLINYYYDNENLIKMEEIDNDSDSIYYEENYYNENCDITKTIKYYLKNNEKEIFADIDYIYDHNNNLIKIISDNEIINEFIYDNENKLIEKYENNIRYYYTYDIQNRVIEIKTLDGKYKENFYYLNNITIRKYHYLDENIFEIRKDNLVLYREYNDDFFNYIENFIYDNNGNMITYQRNDNKIHMKIFKNDKLVNIIDNFQKKEKYKYNNLKIEINNSK